MTSLNMGNEIVVIDDMGVKTFDEKFLPLSRVNINPEIKLAECVRLAKDKDGNLVTINVSGLGKRSTPFGHNIEQKEYSFWSQNRAKGVVEQPVSDLAKYGK